MAIGRRGLVLGLEDILNEHREQRPGWNWHKYISKALPNDFHSKYKTKRTERIHRFILNKFFEMVVLDIIDNNVQFDFNINNEVLLSLLIADRERKSSIYRYRIDNRGHAFIPYCITSEKVMKKTVRPVLFRIGRLKWSRLHKAIQNGKEYEMAPTYLKR